MDLDCPHLFTENLFIQNELLSENALVKITITKKIPKIFLIIGEFGPFFFGKKTKVPLWVAIFLQRKAFCQISNPSWFELNWLEKKVKQEKQNLSLYSVPFNYYEIALLIFREKKKSENFIFTKISLIEELYTLRFTKLWNGIKKLKGKITALKFEKISLLELEAFKEILQTLLFLYLFI
mmetsp:Transcript_45750/g.91566  ORF Transcript_45750/g.91566 Transcript_45750/m.91566 type:complete len:180 (-) Transcript_45750:2118-2657(-)